ncbi:hypothetical protein PAP18089_03051 [Pandoraea apista]|uniref:Uncharacterized protein n=1 Tax=Pandoraea apista TaxID=93218 RepID=A0A5E5P8F6_9BURK|nr:hypothetical protein PAP18089_03051 [Pandoraea apista]
MKRKMITAKTATELNALSSVGPLMPRARVAGNRSP